MNKRSTEANEVRMMNAEQLCCYVGLGRNNAVEFAKTVGAEKKIWEKMCV